MLLLRALLFNKIKIVRRTFTLFFVYPLRGMGYIRVSFSIDVYSLREITHYK